MITIQNQNFGVEIELTGITRQAAAQVIADYYGTIGTRFMGTAYKTYDYLPQDFPTYEEAKEYGNEEFGPEGYVIESTSGYCV